MGEGEWAGLLPTRAFQPSFAGVTRTGRVALASSPPSPPPPAAAATATQKHALSLLGFCCPRARRPPPPISPKPPRQPGRFLAAQPARARQDHREVAVAAAAPMLPPGCLGRARRLVRRPRARSICFRRAARRAGSVLLQRTPSAPTPVRKWTSGSAQRWPQQAAGASPPRSLTTHGQKTPHSVGGYRHRLAHSVALRGRRRGSVGLCEVVGEEPGPGPAWPVYLQFA